MENNDGLYYMLFSLVVLELFFGVISVVTLSEQREASIREQRKASIREQREASIREQQELRIIPIEDINHDGTNDVGYKNGNKITPMYGVLNPATGQTEYITAKVYQRLHPEKELDYDLLERRLNELLAGKVPDTLELELEKREAEQQSK